MNKKLRIAINVALIAVFCLVLFSGCTTKKVNPWEIEDNLDLVGKLIKVMHEWIGSYGWTVVVFTVFLKILMLPLDIWQRYSTKKMSAKMQELQPLIADIDKRYGANTQRGNEEKQKLFKKKGYSMTSSCLPMIVTMVVFFVMFGGLRSYSTYSSVQTFNGLTQSYYQTFAEQIVNTEGTTDAELLAKETFIAEYVAQGGVLVDGKYQVESYTKEEYSRVYNSLGAVTTKISSLNSSASDTDKALATALSKLQQDNKAQAILKVQEHYTNVEEGWLWIQNIAQPDTWESIMPQYNKGTNSFTTLVDMSGYGDADNGQGLYNTIRDAVLQTGDRGEAGKWNGLMILPILSVGLSFLSMFVTQALEKKKRTNTSTDKQQQQTSKMMMIMMPLMMAYFGFIYTGAFAIYMVTNYLLSMLTTIALHAPIEKMVQRNLAKTPSDSGKASYMR